jgi:hypothetical protein
MALGVPFFFLMVAVIVFASFLYYLEVRVVTLVSRVCSLSSRAGCGCRVGRRSDGRSVLRGRREGSVREGTGGAQGRKGGRPTSMPADLASGVVRLVHALARPSERGASRVAAGHAA